MITTSPTRSAALAAAAVRLARQAGVKRPPVSAEPTIATLPAAQPPRLRLLLVILDVVAAAGAWGLAAWGFRASAEGPSLASRVVAVTLLALATVAVADARRLYRAQVCSIRAIEVQRMGQVALLVAAATAIAGPQLGLRLPTGEVLVGGLATFALGTTLRGAYRGWLAANRSQGRFQRQVVIVGGDTDTLDLCELVAEHPQLGLDVVGLIGETGGLQGWPSTVDLVAVGPWVHPTPVDARPDGWIERHIKGHVSISEPTGGDLEGEQVARGGAKARKAEPARYEHSRRAARPATRGVGHPVLEASEATWRVAPRGAPAMRLSWCADRRSTGRSSATTTTR